MFMTLLVWSIVTISFSKFEYFFQIQPSYNEAFSVAIKLFPQPNNNHIPNNKITKTVVGLRLSNRWEPPPPTTETQN